MPERLLKHFSRQEKQTIFVAIGALRVKNFLKSQAHLGKAVLRCQRLKLFEQIVIFSEYFVLANSAYPDKMSHHLGFNCLPKYT